MTNSYSVARYSFDDGGFVSINEYETYSDAEQWLDHYADIYDHSYVEIVPTSTCIH